MSKGTLYLSKKDLVKMLEVAEKFPEYEDKNFKIKYYSCELGSTINMIIETTVEGIKGELVIPIVDVSEW